MSIAGCRWRKAVIRAITCTRCRWKRCPDLKETGMLRIEGMGIARGQGNQTYRVSLPSLQLRRCEVAAITGPSGCGKSTLLEMIGLILAPAQLKSFTLGDTPAVDIAALLQQDAQAPP